MRKVLVIGSLGHIGATCAGWFSSSIPNVADFDVVVVNSTSLTAIIRKERDDSGKLPFSRLKACQAWLAKLRERLRKVLASGGTVLAIIDNPVTTVGLKDTPPVEGWPVFMSSSDWIPLPVDIKEESGDTVLVKMRVEGRESGALQKEIRALRKYITAVKAWTFILAAADEGRANDKLEELQTEHDFQHVEVRLIPVAVNRQNLPIAGLLTYRVHKGDKRSWSSTWHFSSGPLYLLPPPTSESTDEAIRTLLERFCGLKSRTIEPDYARQMTMPGEAELDVEVEKRTREIAEMRQIIEELLARKARRRRFLALTYGTGIEELQQVAREAFDEMGLKTWDADPEVSDEFMVGDGNSQVLIEVKGIKKSASKDHLRQLDESMDEYERKYGHSVKGVLLVNAWNEKPIGERDSAGNASFPDNVVKRAIAIDAALVSGVELYYALCAVWQGKLTGKEIFARLLGGCGRTQLTG